MENKERRLRVVMLPWLAHGHISPFLELAKKLTQRNFYVYLCSTSINFSSIKQQLIGDNDTTTLFPFIELVEHHLPSTPDLPPHYHSTKSVPPYLMPVLKKAFDNSQPSFSNLLKLLNPDLVIFDLMKPWAYAVASAHSIPAAAFSICSAIHCAFFLHMVINPGVPFPFPSIHFTDQQELYNITQPINETEDTNVGSFDRSSMIVLTRSFREIEGKYIDLFSSLVGTQVLPTGPLIYEKDPSSAALVVGDDKPSMFIEWLNNKDTSSVVYVAFGSECFLSKEEIQEMAYGLELSKVSFIWVIRFPAGGAKISVDEVLPEGFLSRIGERGIIVEGWAPQKEILKHCSTGGFVSHCGWSSVIEGMQFGVPFIAMPINSDQPINARLLVELGAGIEVKREKHNNGTGEERIARDAVAKVINEVVIDKVGETLRKKVKELSEMIMSKKNREEEMDIVVEKLLQLCVKSSKNEQ